MYSDIIKKSAVFSSSDIFQTMNDIRVYKSRIEYMTKIHDKYNNFDFQNSADNEKLNLFNKQMTNISACGSVLTFKTLESDHTVGKLANGSFCRQRICPLCQRRRSLKLFSNIQQILEPVKNKYSFIHLTLTIPSVSSDSCKESINNIFESSKILFNTPQVKKSFKGIIRSLEVTYNPKTDMMHPHLHCLVLVNKSYFTSRDYINYDKMRELWGDIIGHNSPQIHLRKCTDLTSALCEVVKYAAKPIDTKSENLGSYSDYEALLYYMNVATALKGRRLLQTFGICAELSRAFHIDLNSDEEEELLPEFTFKQFYSYDYDRKTFFADILRKEFSEEFSIKDNPTNLELKYMSEHKEEFHEKIIDNRISEFKRLYD